MQTLDREGFARVFSRDFSAAWFLYNRSYRIAAFLAAEQTPYVHGTDLIPFGGFLSHLELHSMISCLEDYLLRKKITKIHFVNSAGIQT